MVNGTGVIPKSISKAECGQQGKMTRTAPYIFIPLSLCVFFSLSGVVYASAVAATEER